MLDAAVHRDPDAAESRRLLEEHWLREGLSELEESILQALSEFALGMSSPAALPPMPCSHCGKVSRDGRTDLDCFKGQYYCGGCWRAWENVSLENVWVAVD
mmetsp:Transcript_34082/g.62516  ORF Transcript_34082/g.62516 Transcript_34082/m.62516 type:complete len:101 (+) Transcript_34082:1-303(+)